MVLTHCLKQSHYKVVDPPATSQLPLDAIVQLTAISQLPGLIIDKDIGSADSSVSPRNRLRLVVEIGKIKTRGSSQFLSFSPDQNTRKAAGYGSQQQRQR